MIDRLRRSGIPIVSYHLDRWWGLDREEQVRTEPFFRTDLVCTPDGGAPWDEIGVEHAWFPPAVLGSECELGTPRDEYRSELAFVGSWQHGYHAEWRHRPELVRFLRDRYGDRCRFWPRPNEHAVRGEDLRDLYASVEVIVGDSCLVPYATGDPVSGYCSDRVPETLGRGGCLIHPYALNVIGRQGEPGLWEDGLHLYAWPVGEWDDLAWHIDRLLDEPVIREGLREYGRAHTLQHHTYERRMVELEGLLVDRGLVAVA
jgi:hypothetical protein